MAIRYWLVICAVLFLVTPGTIDAKKVALIIGNSNYDHTTTLANPVNDAMLIAASADEAGFDDVTMALDLTTDDFQQTLREFRKKADGADVAMVYYAGHGIEGQGKNWLIPVNAELNASLDLPYEAMELDRVMESLSGAQIRMVVLDACRNNPFARSWKSSTRAVNRGLAGIEVDDVLVIYAAAPGQTAMDGGGVHSPFAASFATRLPQAGLPVQLLGGMVRDDVLSETGGSQRPFVSASITGTPVYLVEGGDRLVLSSDNEFPETAALNESELDALAWKGALGVNSMRSYRLYLDQFPAGQFAELASDNIAKLAGTDSDGSAEKPIAGLIAGFLPNKADVVESEPLPIDGIWKISTLKKRIKIEKGRAFAIDGWTHAFILKVMPDMVVFRNMERTGNGQYHADDLPLLSKAEMTLKPDGNISVKVKTAPFPTSFTLIRETLEDADAMAAEQDLLTAEK
ncbi:MAG: caspase family protein [Parasphingorhabdus sp.]